MASDPAAPLPAKSARTSAVTMTEIVLPGDANALGTVFGGKVLQWIDLAAATCALRHARRTCVTASIDQVDFHEPIKVGHIAILTARLNGVGRTSMEISVEVAGEHPLTGEVKKATSALLTFVAQDEHGQATPVPPLLVETEEDGVRAVEAAHRRSARRRR